ncbi:AI-2E family transporter [Deinococcus irradiatisoli]|uniref:AI-2E family transporter n=1 Tax=Deinococcus irradiatisoli TaxID=2202254 RepID=UPI001FEAF8F3|nr:AI-2E family transporter [Deinococcus irradiatisoli]
MLPQPQAPTPPPLPSGNAFQVIWRNPYLRAAVFVLLLYLAYRVLGTLTHVITLALIAYIIAYLAHPMLVMLERRKINRAVGVLVTLVVLIGLLVLASGLLVTVVNQIADLVKRLPDLTREFVDQPWFISLVKRFPPLASLRDRIAEFSQNGAAGVQQYIQPYLNKILPYLQANSGAFFGSVLSIAGVVGEGFAVLIMSIYMMLDYEKIGLNFLRLFPRNWQPFVLDLSKNVGQAVGGYLKGQLIIAAFVGIFIGVALSFAGIPSAPAIGFIAGAFNIVPYLGVVIGIAPALLLAASAGGLIKIIIVVVVFVVANQIEGHLLSPMVLGRTTNLHPVTVIIAILTGLTLMGIVGALLAVPLAALGKLLLQEYYYPSRVYKEGP